MGVNHTQESHLQNGHAYEVVGKVMNDLSVRVLMSTDLGVGVVGTCVIRFPSLQDLGTCDAR